MTTDFPTASVGSSQAPTAAVEKSQSASNTEIQTLPGEPLLLFLLVGQACVYSFARRGRRLTAEVVWKHSNVLEYGNL